MSVLYINNDNLVSFTGHGKLKDIVGDAIPGATVSMTLYAAGTSTEVSGQSWPVVFIAGDNDGEYFGTLQDGLNLTFGSQYDLHITAVKDTSKAHWRKTFTAQYRTF